MEIPGNDDSPHIVKMDMQQVHLLMSRAMPLWVSKAISSSDRLILDTIHACNSEEQYRLMMVFPNEVMAYSLFMMNRNAKFMDLLLGRQNSSTLDQLLDMLAEIRDAEEREAAEKEAGDTEDSERKEVH